MAKSLLSKMPCLLVILLCLLLSVAAKTSAAEISGMWGTCPWRIDNGTLTISAGTGSDTGGICPWKEYSRSIWYIVTEPGVVLPADCSHLFCLDGCSYVDISETDSHNVTNMDYLFPDEFFDFKLGKQFSFINQTNGAMMVDDAFRALDNWEGSYDYLNLRAWKTKNNKPIKARQIATERNGVEDMYYSYQLVYY